jgi:AcrR family transcriptional regulator
MMREREHTASTSTAACRPPAKSDIQLSAAAQSGSARKRQLLEAAYAYVAEHGLADMSLRPLAEAIGSSPRVLLFLFDSKDGLVQALLARARADEIAMLRNLRTRGDGMTDVAHRVWGWLVDPAHRRVLMLWVEAYARSLVDSTGPWAGFARRTVQDWLDILAAAQPTRRRRSARGAAERTMVLAVLRGALLDLLATGDVDRTTAAVTAHLTVVKTVEGRQTST